MNLIHNIRQSFFSFITDRYDITHDVLETIDFSLNTDAQKQAFGDITTNCALILAKKLNRAPLDLAREIAHSFTQSNVETIVVAGPGFLNFSLHLDAFKTIAFTLFQEKESFFTLPSDAPKESISLEFVSANPTGPLHIGNGRGGIIGDVLGTILRFLGHRVTKEFYINDAGEQIRKLGLSFKVRCEQVAGKDIEMPPEGYYGDYLITLAKTCYETYGIELLNKPESFFAEYAKNALLKEIKHTLEIFGIHYDVWFSEKTLHEDGSIENALQILKDRHFLYEKDGALWFRSTEFGDDKDRVVKKASGEYTYVAPDIAYLKNKIDRGHNHLIITLGHDHHGYVERLHAVLDALGLGNYPLDVILYQLVKIKSGGELVRLSKRAGTIIGLADLIDEVGKDVARFFFLNRKADVQLDFDLVLALKKTEENPVFYIQYAYVRTGSILHKARQEIISLVITEEDAKYITQEERLLLKKIVSLYDLLRDINRHFFTHTLAFYTIELAQIFSNYYAHHRIIDSAKPEQTRGRLLLSLILRNTVGLCLDLMGISKPEKM